MTFEDVGTLFYAAELIDAEVVALTYAPAFVAHFVDPLGPCTQVDLADGVPQDWELGVPFLPAMDEVRVTTARLDLRGLRVAVPAEGWTATAQSKGFRITLAQPARLVAIAFDPPQPATPLGGRPDAAPAAQPRRSRRPAVVRRPAVPPRRRVRGDPPPDRPALRRRVDRRRPRPDVRHQLARAVGGRGTTPPSWRRSTSRPPCARSPWNARSPTPASSCAPTTTAATRCWCGTTPACSTRRAACSRWTCHRSPASGWPTGWPRRTAPPARHRRSRCRCGWSPRRVDRWACPAPSCASTTPPTGSPAAPRWRCAASRDRSPCRCRPRCDRPGARCR